MRSLEANNYFFKNSMNLNVVDLNEATLVVNQLTHPNKPSGQLRQTDADNFIIFWDKGLWITL